MSVSTPPLQACRTCDHGRNIRRVSGALGLCDLKHETLYRIPEHEHDDQGGYYRECADHVQRAEVIDAEEEAAT